MKQFYPKSKFLWVEYLKISKIQFSLPKRNVGGMVVFPFPPYWAWSLHS